MKKLISLALAIIMLLTVSAALAKTVTPDDEYKGLEGTVVHATVGEYNPDTKTFRIQLPRIGWPADGRAASRKSPRMTTAISRPRWKTEARSSSSRSATTT